jgi:phosphoenolpyruvate synthase/pyruvate phosphate dikinase
LTAFTLDDARAFDPVVSGAKAATLARARLAGLPVLAGLVVPAPLSRETLAAGSQVLAQSNSGRARATVIGSALASGVEADIIEGAARLGARLVVRSSAPVEGSGAWAGAFASYAELAPSEVMLGVRGCWASVFAPDPLERARTTGESPAVDGMAVLIQPEIDPAIGGVATVDRAGEVTIVAVAGPPAAIVSGWEPGWVLVVDDGGPGPPHAVEAVGRDRVAAVARLARDTAAATGAPHIEWAEADGKLWLLQAQSSARRAVPSPPTPGIRPADDDPAELIRQLRAEVEQRGAADRSGITRWEPALYELVSESGRRSVGRPAAAGWGAGELRLVRDGSDADRVRPRQVIAAVYPLSNLAPLLWDAAGLVTAGGSPGAHLFEVAAWLGLPAVCGIDLEEAAGQALDELRASRSLIAAVDGTAGTMAVLEVGAD